MNRTIKYHSGAIENLDDNEPLIIEVPAGKMAQLGNVIVLQTNEGFTRDDLVNQLIEAHEQILNNETPMST